jgi:hypothetical protein
MKNSTDTIGNRTRDLPALGAVPQPTSSPVVSFIYYLRKLVFMLQSVMVQDVAKGFRP